MMMTNFLNKLFTLINIDACLLFLNIDWQNKTKKITKQSGKLLFISCQFYIDFLFFFYLMNCLLSCFFYVHIM